MNHKYLRRLSALLCAAVLLLGLCGSAFAAESKSGDYRYSVNADGSLTLTAYTGSASSLHIPAELDGKHVTAIGESCFAGLLNLERVYVPEGVTELGSYAFECCADLQKIYLPDSLRRIGEGAFSGCAALSLADIQAGLESIGRGAFLCCDSLVQLELPESLAELGEFAFAECEALSSVRFLGSGVTVLPDRLFHGCVSLNRLVLPQSVSVIGKRAFSGCEALTNLYFGQELTGLGAYAFENCKRLSTLTVKAEAIPEGLAYGCEALSWFNLEEGVRSLGYRAFGGTGIDSLSLPASLVLTHLLSSHYSNYIVLSLHSLIHSLHYNFHFLVCSSILYMFLHLLHLVLLCFLLCYNYLLLTVFLLHSILFTAHLMLLPMTVQLHYTSNPLHLHLVDFLLLI